MATSLEHVVSGGAVGGRTMGDVALFVVAIVAVASIVQFFVARSLRRHGRPAQQAENLATAAAATMVAVLVPIAVYMTRT